MEIIPFRTPDLGDTSYLLSHDGRAILIDPQRDYERFLPDDDIEVRWILETHLHNDYVSGAVAAAEATGAELVLPAAAAPAYRHTPAFHREEFGAGGIRILPLHTPGHTPEHTSYVVFIDDEVVAVFSGGSLLVGAAGRSDLLGPERADTLARLQYGSVLRLSELPDHAALYPTHGEGSFCATTGAGKHTSTIGEERRSNQVLQHPDADAFVKAHLGGLDPFPAYYRHMGPANLRGPEARPSTAVPVVPVTEIVDRHPDAVIIDTRERHAYAAGHLPGSIGVEFGDSFATWTGWLIDHDAPMVLVLDAGTEVDDAVTRLQRIGMDDVRAVSRDLDGSATASHRTVTVTETTDAIEDGAQVLDVRAPSEREASAVPGSIHRYLPDLVSLGIPDELDPERPVWLVCGSGLRASIAAGFLERAGYEPVVFTSGGSDDLVAALRTDG